MKGNGPEETSRGPIEIAIACYPGAQETCVYGLSDLFMYADYFARMHAASCASGTPRPVAEGEQPILRTTSWRQTSNVEWPAAYPDDRRPGHETPNVVIVPAYQLGPPDRDHASETIAWVARMHAQGAIIAAVCGGVFLLADSGLLDGRRATTHWAFASEFRQRYPQLRLEPESLVIDDGDVVTAGGVLAWADMGLTLVERLLGRAVMCSTARFMLMEPPRREQRVYGDFLPWLRHGDEAIVAIQHWLQSNAHVNTSVAALAERAGLGSRTFLRRFARATGIKPSDYQQRLRIMRARELLECTRRTVEQIAAATGYEDTRGFRRTFKRVVGLSPVEYRSRFQVSSAQAAPGPATT